MRTGFDQVKPPSREDQAIAHGGPDGVKAHAIRDMLGLSDRADIVTLFERTMGGEIAAALDLVRSLHQAGGDAEDILIEVAEFCHYVAAVKIAPDLPDSETTSETERVKAREFAVKLSMGSLTRAWQILLKGLEDVRDSPRPLASLEMALIRLAYASDLPTPDEALRFLAEAGEEGPPPTSGGGRRNLSAAAAPASAPAPAERAPPPAEKPRLARFEDVVALARAKRDIRLVQALERDVRLERFEEGSIALSLVEGASPGLQQILARRLQEWTGERWMVSLAQNSNAPTLRETAQAREAERTNDAAAHPLVRKALDRFKGARIVEVRTPEAAAAPPAAPQADEDVGYADSEPVVDDDL